MESFASLLRSFERTLGPEASKIVKAKRNNRRFAEAVRRAWDDNPLAADYLLAHVNALYFAREQVPGRADGVTRAVLGVYMDDPTARAELNARRESLALALLKDGSAVDDVRILPSRMGMKERSAFPDAARSVERALYGKEADPGGGLRQKDRPERAGRLAHEDEVRLLAAFKRAACLAIGDIDRASAFLAEVEGAEIADEGSRRRLKHRARTIRLYSSSDALAGIVGAYGDSIIANAKELGSPISRIEVRESPEELRGSQAFPASARPVPYHRGG